MKSRGTGDTRVTAEDRTQANNARRVSESFIKHNASKLFTMQR